MEWQMEDRKTLKKINDLIRDVQRNGLLQGIGKPEFLKHLKAYSRRIDDAAPPNGGAFNGIPIGKRPAGTYDTNRLIYTADENKNLHIIACKGHYT
jgi:toxin YoeB